MLIESVAAALILSGANYADYSTTRQALARGGVEANGLMQGPRMAPLKVAATAGETAAFVALHRKSKAMAWTFVGVIVGTNLVIANHNRGVNR